MFIMAYKDTQYLWEAESCVGSGGGGLFTGIRVAGVAWQLLANSRDRLCRNPSVQAGVKHGLGLPLQYVVGEKGNFA